MLKRIQVGWQSVMETHCPTCDQCVQVRYEIDSADLALTLDEFSSLMFGELAETVQRHMASHVN